jgi:hypothetical protein
MKRKNYTVQALCSDGKHRTKAFFTLEEATQFAQSAQQWTIKQRNKCTVNDPFVGEIKTWGIVAESNCNL